MTESVAVVLQCLNLLRVKVDEVYNSLPQGIGILGGKEQARLKSFHQFLKLAVVAGNDRRAEAACLPQQTRCRQELPGIGKDYGIGSKEVVRFFLLGNIRFSDDCLVLHTVFLG